MISLYMCSLKYGTNDLMYKIKKQKNRLTDIENKLMVIRGERGLERHKLGVWNQQTDCPI